MRRLVPCIVLLLATGCDARPGGPRTDKPGGGDSSPDETGDTSDSASVDPFAFPAPAALSWGHFATAAVCSECHDNADGADAMRDAAGRSVAPFDLWGATTMANASRNPYWWAAVAAETAAQPAHAADIEAECMTCHAPAVVAEKRLSGGAASLDDLLGDDDAAVMGLDGVTCTVCHQIEPTGLGEASTFSGAYPILGRSVLYGPYTEPFSHPMEMHTGYMPTEGSHIRDAGLCATCHTLTTSALDEAGVPTGEHLHEQSPYLEWKNADAGRAGVTCQTCHVPQDDEDGNPISTKVAHNPSGGDFSQIGERSPYGRHVFVGGNAYMLRILRDNRERLQTYASVAAFDENIARTVEFLGGAATLSVGEPTRGEGAVEVPVTVTNLTGHKLPTGYPSRRVWLHVVARDGDGVVVFESGATDERGRIVGSDGAVRPEELAGGPVYTHLDQVAAGEVQVWQSLMADASGAPTYRLLSGGHYLVDDRILPAGWSAPDGEAAGIAPVGVDGDADFAAGSDTVRYLLPAVAVSVEAELLYQSGGPRHLAEIFAFDDPRIRAFEEMADAADPGPEQIATVSVTLGG